MPEATPDRYRRWAIASSVLCVALIGYIVAAHRAAPRPAPDGQASPPPAVAGEAGVDVPPALRDGPRQWTSRSLGPGATGHAVVLDPAGTRELVVERCRHRGYFDVDRGEVRPTDWRFCEPVLQGTIVSMDAGRLVVRAPVAGTTVVAYRSAPGGDTGRLMLELGDARLDLVPGTRNDLYQRMDALPAIAAEREAWLRSMAGADAAPDAGTGS